VLILDWSRFRPTQSADHGQWRARLWCIAGSKESVRSSAARVHTPRYFNRGDLFLLHCLLNLPSDCILGGDCTRLFKDALFLEEIVERRSNMLVALFIV
jgi:hypothetical protein